MDGDSARVTTSPKARLAALLRMQESFGDVPIVDHVVDLVALACLHLKALGCAAREIDAALHELAAKACAPDGLAGSTPTLVSPPAKPEGPTELVAAVITAKVQLVKTEDGNVVLDLSEVPVAARPKVQAYFGDVLASALLEAVPQVGRGTTEVPN